MGNFNPLGSQFESPYRFWHLVETLVEKNSLNLTNEA